jgi:hypothetical protein
MPDFSAKAQRSDKMTQKMKPRVATLIKIDAEILHIYSHISEFGQWMVARMYDGKTSRFYVPDKALFPIAATTESRKVQHEIFNLVTMPSGGGKDKEYGLCEPLWVALMLNRKLDPEIRNVLNNPLVIYKDVSIKKTIDKEGQFECMFTWTAGKQTVLRKIGARFINSECDGGRALEIYCANQELPRLRDG